MTETPEQSYYEIALTNRQVLIAFVVLLASVVTAFFAGVWVGREQMPIGVGTRAAAAAGGAGDPSAKLEEFEFFPAPPPQPAVPSPQPTTTLLEDLGGASPAPASPSPGEPGEAPADSSADSPADSATPPAGGTVASPSAGAAPAPAASQPPPAATSSAPPTSSPAAPPPASTTAPTAGAQPTIQVFSSNDEVQAKRVLDRLRGGGYRAFLSPVQVGNLVMHRVRVGPFASEAEAKRIADQIQRQFKLDTWITR